MSAARRIGAFYLAVSALGSAGCEGALSGEATMPAPGSAGAGGSSGVTPAVPGPTPEGFLPTGAPLSAPLRRLTRSEYRNTLRELFGVEPPPSELLPEDAQHAGFTSTAHQLVTIAAANRYLDAGAALARSLEPSIRSLAPCSANDAAGEASCIDAFLTGAGSRLFRRPIALDEKARYLNTFSRARVADSYERSASLVLEALVAAPEFLFVELPSGGAPGQLHALDGWQLAARLSLLLWDSIPDQALLTAAESGQLVSPAGMAEQVTRLLADQRAKPAVRAFFDDWLGLPKVETTVRDPALYPNLTKELLAQLLEESRRYVDDVFWQAGDFRQLFVSPVRFRSQALSTFYGDALGQGPGVERYAGELSERSFGLLSQAGFLMTLAQAEKTAAIHRGVFLRRKLLCGVLPPPPPGLATPLPELSAGATSRQRITEHTSGASCVGCHRTFNSLGFALGHLDIAGQWRDTEGGLPIDARVSLTEPGLTADIDGARALSEALAQSPNARACAVQQLFGFALERPPVDGDRPLFDRLGRAFETSGFDLRLVLAELAQSAEFQARIEPAGVGP